MPNYGFAPEAGKANSPVASQVGWAFFDAGTPAPGPGTERPAPLLRAEAKDGQVVLVDAAGAVRWSFVPVVQGAARYVQNVAPTGAAFFTLTLRIGRTSEMSTHAVARLKLLELAASGSEVIDVG